MSTRAAAKVHDMGDMVFEIELDDEMADGVDINAVIVGDPVHGTVVLTHHECPACHSKMQTMGVGHGEYTCSACALNRSQKVKMLVRHESLEG